MKALLFFCLASLLTLCAGSLSSGQEIQLGEILIVHSPVVGDGAEAFESYVRNDLIPAWAADTPAGRLHLLRADRGAERGNYLFVWSPVTPEVRASILTMHGASPFSPSILQRIGSPAPAAAGHRGAYTEYQLIGAERLGELPSVDILGFHYIQVEPDKAVDFEAFVVNTLHPAVANFLPDMKLFYYKAISGESVGNYITLFAIETVAARELYWPTGAPETQLVKDAFHPLKPIALALGSYLVPGTFLESPDAAGAYWESRVWTDFVDISAAGR